MVGDTVPVFADNWRFITSYDKLLSFTEAAMEDDHKGEKYTEIPQAEGFYWGWQ